jgi:dTDP-4-amino-4,6-dideoxygalactose transaminase
LKRNSTPQFQDPGYQPALHPEIGSELDLDIASAFRKDPKPVADIFRSSTGTLVLTQSGRAAIRAALYRISSQRGRSKRFLVPNYLCDATLQPFEELGLEFDVYPVSQSLTIDWNYVAAALDSGKYCGLLLIRYFGSSIHSDPPPKFFEQWPDLAVIEDLAQAFLTRNVGNLGRYVIYSMRKWIGLPDGGAVVIRDNRSDSIVMENPTYDLLSERLLAFELRRLYRAGFLKSKRRYLIKFREAEQILALDRHGVAPISFLSEQILRTANLKQNSLARRRNFSFLRSHLPETEFLAPLPLKWGAGDVPLGFPIVCHRRNWLRRELTSRGIYCPIHWSLPNAVLDGVGKKDALILSRHILTLPCDQRYTESDMGHLIASLRTVLPDVSD